MRSGFCALWGRPNVGKSTLLNVLLGRKHVIVTPRPQTTRHRIVGVLHGGTDDDPFQIVFLDTPGIHQPRHKLGQSLIRSAKGALDDIDIVLFVVDSTDKPHDDDRMAAQMLQSVRAPVLLAINKIDKATAAGVDMAARSAEFAALREFDAVVPISALDGTGLDTLKQEVIRRLPEGDPYFPPDMTSDRPPEFHIEELIREQAMLQLHEELPHSVAVAVEQMEPRPGGLLFIEALLYVERDSQKHIVIGKGGARIREIGQQARKGIQKLLNRPVYLDLRVKVREKWRDNEMWIQRLGYE